MIVLGVDCGSEATGYGVVASDGHQHRLLEAGTLRLHGAEPFAAKLHRIHSTITELLARHEPGCVAIEDIFFAKNVRSALKLGHVRGVVMQAAAARGIAVAEYTPLAVKSALTGYGRADKTQVQHMVCSLLRLSESPDSLDASDALAVAICHLHSTHL
ncbi:MAG: crossover junction endodeoxyribonuclease RuvC [Terriglobales bacterium]